MRMFKSPAGPWLFIAIVLFCHSCRPITALAVELVKDGTPVARIYVSPMAPPPEVRGKVQELALAMAVRELNYHLQKMTGTPLEVVQTTDASAIKPPGIVLGDLAVKLGAVPQKTVASGEGFRLLTQKNQVLIGGQSEDAVLFGTYELLRRLGCDWVMPGEIGEIIPSQKSVSVPALDESQAPNFLVRDLWFSGGVSANSATDLARCDEWLRRQKRGNYSPPIMQTQGHYWQEFIRKHKPEFEKDPTMYALVRTTDGRLVRKGPQIETTHPRVIELFVEDVKAAFEKNKWLKDREAGFPVGPADGFGFSVSPETLAAGSNRINPVAGDYDQTDQLVQLANTIIERLGVEYPNVWLGFYSYSWHGDYPARYKPHPRVVPWFAPISFSRFQSFLDENSKSQAYYKDVLTQWGQLSKAQGNPLIYRGYSWNLADNILPYTKIRIWGEELPYYHQMGVVALRVEGMRLWGTLGPSDYVFMRLAWDSSQNWKTLLREYCQHSFGAGWQPMENYYLRLAERQHGAGQEAGSFHAFPLIYDEAFITAAEQDFTAAKAQAKQLEEKLRVDFAITGIKALKSYLAFNRAAAKFDFANAQKAYDEILAGQQRTLELNPDLTNSYGRRYPVRFLSDFVTEAIKYSAAPYQIVEPLPDEMPTLLDPNAVGQQMRFQSPALNDAGMLKTKTYSSTWDAQGLGALRDGAVWYRHHFKLPPALKDQAVGLFLGGFDSEARVWINGQLVGTSGARFSKPTVFDLTAHLRYEGDNVVAIQVIRHGLNELGVGGLFRPSFLFTGPRLPQAAPRILEEKRVLPGGEEDRPQCRAIA